MFYPPQTEFFNSILKEYPIETAINFKTADDAFSWFETMIGDCYYDNHRFVYVDDLKSPKAREYFNLYSDGCCASDDVTVIVNGRLAIIGCNFGH